MAAGLGHNLAVTTEGKVVAWGWNGAGQLGLGADRKEEVVTKPTPVYGLPENCDALVAAGKLAARLCRVSVSNTGVWCVLSLLGCLAY